MNNTNVRRPTEQKVMLRCQLHVQVPFYGKASVKSYYLGNFIKFQVLLLNHIPKDLKMLMYAQRIHKRLDSVLIYSKK